MFTGLVEKVGRVLANTPGASGRRLVIDAFIPELQEGESIAVNGTCLTWLPESPAQLQFDVSPETLDVTTLGSLQEGEPVNLERAMMASTRLGGHYVCGHVNTTAFLKERRKVSGFTELVVSGFSEAQRKYLVPKGSITLDGVSLTINDVRGREISLMIVPYTLENTTLKFIGEGKKINVEFDYIAQIVAYNLSLVG
ncbi:riboflavin synthase subunit alpha [Legionella birminghamensis]|uniref:Riboflavin synthase n=1 Tax=Legionella birminghamensis TaxID=28083 RepID=A0A378I9C2_9GAMM|nr:riboflavin synthase [Legionella birminghamensis]KTC69360.1 riboflavin synthase subunit alpha [Legionella birminghamensis]STX31623.1 riboflavin synthase subunit alpha [Legionella birminghamensis]